MEFIDTHAHLDFEYDEGKTLEDIVDEAKKDGVSKIITVASAPDSLDSVAKIAASFDGVYHSLGIHPHDSKSFSPEIEKQILKLNNPKCVAIGETGLDYYYEHSERQVQKKAFIKQIDIARELKLPLIIHIREAYKDAYEILRSEFKDICPAVLHCYTGSKEDLKKFLDLGIFVSFTGIITFDKATNVKESALYAPIDRMMLETDAPFLAPIPHRGKKNYPKYTVLIAKKIAEIKNMELSLVADKTTKNASSLFGF